MVGRELGSAPRRPLESGAIETVNLMGRVEGQDRARSYLPLGLP